MPRLLAFSDLAKQAKGHRHSLDPCVASCLCEIHVLPLRACCCGDGRARAAGVGRLVLPEMEFGQQGENGATPRADIDKKYDRQVRIWGAHGQARLEAAQICMLGAGPIATETLKNLVLGGTASFTVVDDAVVQERDLGNNFFFERADLGKGRAETATRLLCELNEHVKGSFSDESVLDLLPDPRRYFERFSLVIATDVRSRPHPCTLLASHRTVLMTAPATSSHICLRKPFWSVYIAPCVLPAWAMCSIAAPLHR